MGTNNHKKYPWRGSATADKKQNFTTTCFHRTGLLGKRFEANNTKCSHIFENLTSRKVKGMRNIVSIRSDILLTCGTTKPSPL